MVSGGRKIFMMTEKDEVMMIEPRSSSQYHTLSLQKSGRTRSDFTTFYSSAESIIYVIGGINNFDYVNWV